MGLCADPGIFVRARGGGGGGGWGVFGAGVQLHMTEKSFDNVLFFFSIFSPQLILKGG